MMYNHHGMSLDMSWCDFVGFEYGQGQKQSTGILDFLW